jgi:hypothetical protein
MSEERDDKEARWRKVAEHFQQVTDRLGRPIDPPIFETVVALNVLGLPTSMSCGGHLDDGRGLLLPWVDIRAFHPRAQKWQKKLQKLQKKAEKLRRKERRQQKNGSSWLAVKATEKELAAIYKKIHPRRLRLRLVQCDTRAKLVQLLTQFYENRQVPFDQRLILQVMGDGHTRLSHQGGEDFYLTSPYELQRQKLEAYREEMRAFTLFLKEAYYQTSSLVSSAEAGGSVTRRRDES